MEQHSVSTHQEILEFILSALWLGVAFAIAMSGGYTAFSNPEALKITVFQSLIVVFFAFVCHELAHRVMARHYGYKARYRMWFPGLIIALLGSLLALIFAAPGAVHIDMDMNAPDARKKLGASALAGPLMNMILAVVFAGLTVYFISVVQAMTLNDVSFTRIEPTLNFIYGILVIGVQINAWMAVFNLLPIGQFDGFKVFLWNKVVWGISFAVSIAIFGGMYWAQANLF
jgi:Zn-dependent protease